MLPCVHKNSRVISLGKWLLFFYKSALLYLYILMKISSPFYSFYAIFFALAMLNAPPLEKDINCYRYKAEAYIVIETFIPEQVEDTVTHHPAGFKCFKDSLTCEKSLTFPDPQRKWNLFFRERPKNSSQFLRAAFPRKSKRNQLQHKQNKTHRAGI